MIHKQDKIESQMAEETRYEEKARICRDEVALTAIALGILCSRLVNRLGVSDARSMQLVCRLEDRHRIRAADMLSDAFGPDAIHSLMRDCAKWGSSVRSDQDFQAIHDQLKGIGVEKCANKY